MKVSSSPIEGLLLLEPVVHRDARGFFLESWRQDRLAALGLPTMFVQDNHSHSVQGTLRGLHYQLTQPQGKLVRVVSGEVFDVAVDLRRASGTFGKWVAERLSGENHRMMWVPPGFAHGFLVLSERAEFLYKTTDYYAPEHERTLLWNDPALGIPWPVRGEPVLKPRDAAGARLADAETFP